MKLDRMNKCLNTAAMAACVLAATAAIPAQATPVGGQVDTFPDQGAPVDPVPLNPLTDFSATQGWRADGRNAAPNGNPASVADPLNAGNNALFMNGTGVGGGLPGRVDGRPIVFNRSQWAGDYTAAGIYRIEFDFMADVPDTLANKNMSIRIALRTGTEAQLVNANTASGWVWTLPVVVTDDNQWHHLSFDLLESNFTHITSVGSPSLSFADTLANVGELRIMHSTVNLGAAGALTNAASLHASRVDNNFFLDNIHAVPEPGSLALAGFSLLGLLASRRRQVSSARA